jgi:hypothetical protein
MEPKYGSDIYPTIYDLLTSHDEKESSKLEQTVDDLARCFEIEHYPLTTERLKFMIELNLWKHKKQTFRAKMGFSPSLRSCLIKSVEDLSKTLKESCFLPRSSSKYFESWSYIKDSVYGVINIHY